MPRGVVNFFNFDRGYGTIRPDDGGFNIFAHISNVRGGFDHLPEGTPVTYEVAIRRKTGQPQAIKIRVIEE